MYFTCSSYLILNSNFIRQVIQEMFTCFQHSVTSVSHSFGSTWPHLFCAFCHIHGLIFWKKNQFCLKLFCTPMSLLKWFYKPATWYSFLLVLLWIIESVKYHCAFLSQKLCLITARKLYQHIMIILSYTIICFYQQCTFPERIKYKIISQNFRETLKAKYIHLCTKSQ